MVAASQPVNGTPKSSDEPKSKKVGKGQDECGSQMLLSTRYDCFTG